MLLLEGSVVLADRVEVLRSRFSSCREYAVLLVDGFEALSLAFELPSLEVAELEML
jgi:hypothetical protein